MPPRTKTVPQRVTRRKEVLPKNLDLLPSVSRSGGTAAEGDGDSLKLYSVQETYRHWIDQKLLEYEKTGWKCSFEQAKLTREDIILRFRKLREGVMASNRCDAFATEVYESSLFLAAAYEVPEQVTAIAAQILPHYTLEYKHKIASSDRFPREITLFLILIHRLFMGTHSTSSCQWVITALTHPSISHHISKKSLDWLKQLRLEWRVGNYCAVWRLTSVKEVEGLLHDILSFGIKGEREKAAVLSTVKVFRSQAREIAWNAMRAAYREENEPWILCSLSLNCDDAGWIFEKQKLQEALRIAGEPPRWRLYKPKLLM